MERYYLAQDNDSHWLIVPVSKRDSFNKWREISEDDEDSWIYPQYVKEIGGCPSQITFVNPKIGDK